MKALEALIEPFLSEKLKDRRKIYGADWLENNEGFFVAEKIPKHFGGPADDEKGLRWIDEYYNSF